MHNDRVKYFVTFLSFSFLTRLISLTFIENYDEWYYLAVWNAIKNGGTLYQTILDNKPPLAYFLYAIPDNISLYVTLSILSAIIACFISKLTDNIYAGHIFLLITGAIPSYMELNLEYWVLACILPAYYYILNKQSVVWHRWAYFLFGTSIMIKHNSLLLVLPAAIYGLYSMPILFRKSAYYAAVVPILCLLYVVYTNTLLDAYLWIIEFNFWYKDLSETGGYIWKRFVYGQLFALPVYAGVLVSVKNIRKNRLHIFLISTFLLAVGSTWIGRELYLHYQLLIFPFLILLFYRISSAKHQKYVFIGTVCVTLFGQTNYVYAYTTPYKTWISRTEGIINYQQKQKIIWFQTQKPLVLSAESTLGLDYHKVKYIASCCCLEFLKKKNPAQKQWFSCNFYLKDAVYVVSKSCLNEYVGDLKYKIVYEYQDNVGIELETCK